MNIIIPMAGAGKRMRPHTLTTPKPLLPIAGRPIVQRLVEGLASMCKDKIDEIAFIIGRFGPETESNLVKIAESFGAKGRICYQDEPLGTAHAILCAEKSLKGPVIVAFADTLFFADFEIDESKDGIIWVQQIEDPKAFGVVVTNKDGIITNFIEKPKDFISDLAIIGIYYFKDGENLRKELQFLLDNNIKEAGEFQLTTALKHMNDKGKKLTTGKVREWLDCGNKDATVYTNQRVLENLKNERLIDKSAVIENSIIIPPCFIDEGVEITSSVIGPYVSIGKNSSVSNTILQNSIIQTNTEINNKVIADSMIGNYVELDDVPENLSIGDYTKAQ
jgi:glucose-1-phosphate thymidylyltransferase